MDTKWAQLRWVFSLVLILFVLVGCGEAEEVVVQAGEWQGTGEQQFRITFTVGDDGKTLTFFSVAYSEACTTQGGFTMSLLSDISMAVGGGQFQFSGTNYQVEGRFVAPDHAEGTWRVDAHRHPEFGDCRATNGSWSAMPIAGPNLQTVTSIPPTVTSVPPTVTPTPVPPTATSVPPTPTITPTSLGPMAGAVFTGALDGGTLTFTIARDGQSIQSGWSIDLQGQVACAEGGSVSNIKGEYSYPVPIQNMVFEYAGDLEFRGHFDTATSASGTLKMKVGAGPSACTFGPLRWAASTSPSHTSTPQPAATQAQTPTARPSSTPTPHTQTGEAPVIESVNLRYDTSEGSLAIFQDITFRDPDGDASKVHYELVHTTAAGVQVADGTLDVSSQQQKRGTTVTGRWACGGNEYDVTLRVTILDRAKNMSNAVDYTMNCR